jgi:hypothetical protein
MEAVIVSKTKMQNSFCVGAILYNGQGLRLLDSKGYNQPLDTKYKIGQIWDIKFTKRIDLKDPHNEDVLVQSASFVNKFIGNLYLFLIDKIRVPVCKGSPNELFDGLIQWTHNGSGYISERTGIPMYSVGFYISDRIIHYDNKHYIFPSDHQYFNAKKLAFVGCEEPTLTISAGILIRVSLARWWKPENVEIEKRCYVQISGWYNAPLKDKCIILSIGKETLIVEKENKVGIYFKKQNEDFSNLEIGFEITWLEITDNQASRKDGQPPILEDGRTVYVAERVHQKFTI